MVLTHKETQKLVQEKCQKILADLLRDEDNKYCVDCDSKGIHRNLGVHISKVKSVNLDAWTPEQVAYIQAMGNSKARAVYEANLPDNFRRPQTDSTLEAFIRAKYEQKKYIAKEWVQQPPPKPAFDIEEEIRKEKEKKRNKSKTPQTTSLEVQPNSLPRPHSSPAGTAINAEKIPQETKTSASNDNNSASVDLLGLSASSPTTTNNNNNDDFAVFATANFAEKSDPTQNATATKDETQNNEESDFFNQKAPVEEKKVLSKESILSLYGSGSSSMPGPAVSMPQNLINPQPPPPQQQQQLFSLGPSQSGLSMHPQAALFMHPQNNIAPGLVQSSVQMSQQQQSLFPVTTNPFLSNPAPNLNQPTATQLSHQMSSLQLGQMAPAPVASHLQPATNSWFAASNPIANPMGAIPPTSNQQPPMPGALINPFITPAPAPMVHGMPTATNALPGGAPNVRSDVFGPVDISMANQWVLGGNNPPANPTLLTNPTGMATNLWQ